MESRAPEFAAARVFSTERALLPDISYTSFTYPGDAEALAALKRVPGAPALLTWLQEHFTEQMILVENNEQMLRAGPRNFSSLHRLVTRCAEILSCPVPDLYITNNPVMNAYTVGHRHTCIVLHSAVVEGMTADELSFIIGHEIGHIKCGHGLYRQLGDLLLRYWDAAVSQITIPGLGLLRIPLLLAFWEWYRRAEHTCDRAGLLCLQSLPPSLSALAKLAGHVRGFEEEVDVDSAIEQGQVLHDVNKLVMVVSILENANNSHPFVPARLGQLKAYAESPEYPKVLRGVYERDFLGLHEGGIRVACPGCGLKVNRKLKHCPQCGHLVAGAVEAARNAPAECQSCARPIAPGIRWCTHCGSEQKLAVAAAQPSGLDKLKSNFGFGKRS